MIFVRETRLKRYQQCSCLEKCWRSRWLLVVPYDAVRSWLHDKKNHEPFDIHWSIARGEADVKRNYYWYMDEVLCMEYLEGRITKQELVEQLQRK